MEVVSNVPFRIAQLRWILSGGAPALTVILKATYLLHPVEAVLAPEQEAPHEEDSYWNDDPQKSLSAATDLVPFKQYPEVVLVGHAFAPRGQPVRSLVARLVVGNVHKAIEVYGERSFALDGHLEEGAPFTKMRLSYERAAASEASNPVGIRFDVQDAYGRTRLPNLQPQGVFVARRGDVFPPIGFGPLSPSWPERRARAQHATPSFDPRGWTQRPFPDRVAPSYFNAAPLDQRLESLHANERITLENLSADHPRLTTSLPGVEPQGYVERPGQAPSKLVMACDTLWIDTDRQICHLVWRATVALSRWDEAGQIVLMTAGGGGGVKGGPPKDPATSEDPSTTTIAAFDSGGSGMTLPFLGTRESRDSAPRRPPPPDAALPFHDPSKPSSPGPRGPVPIPVLPTGDEKDGTLFLDPAVTSALPAISGVAGATSMQVPAGSLGQSTPNAVSPGVSAPQAVLLGVSAAPMSPPMGIAGLPPVPVVVSAPPPPEGVVGPSIGVSSWGAAGSEPAPAAKKGSIGERLAAEQAMAESKAALDKKVRGEPESLGPIQKGANAGGAGTTKSAVSTEAPEAAESAPKAMDAAAAKRGWKPATKKAGVGSAAAVPSDIAKGGAAAASNAALTPNERLQRAPIASEERPQRQAPKEILELLWYDPAYLPRTRRKPEWKDILAAGRARTFDDDPGADAPPEKRQEAKDRKEIFTLLARGTPMDLKAIEEAMDAAVSEDGCFIPPLVLVAGEITFPFDEVETLKATIAAVTPLIGEDKRLQGAVDTAKKLLETPWLDGASELAEAQTAKIKEAFAAGNRALPAGYLEHHTERMLLHRRAYRKRVVLGDEHVRGEVLLAGRPLSAYLPGHWERQLPGLRTWEAKLIAAGQGRVDSRDADSVSLRITAIGRISTKP